MLSTHTLTLYVSGKTRQAQRAIQNVRELCDTELPDFVFNVVDVREHPREADLKNIRSTPTLIKKTPSSQQWMICNFDRKSEVLKGLNIKEEQTATAARNQKQKNQGS